MPVCGQFVGAGVSVRGVLRLTVELKKGKIMFNRSAVN